jgi:hypothetical protein
VELEFFFCTKSSKESFENLEDSPYANRLVVGMPISIQRLFHFTGINEETGLYNFEDYNGDGIITEEDRKYFIDLSPKFYGSLNQNLNYGNWSLNFMFQFVKRNAFTTMRSSPVPGMMFNQPAEMLSGVYQQLYTSGLNTEALSAFSNFQLSNGVVSDASFIRLKTLSMSYRIPSSLVGVGECILSLYGHNLLTLTKYKGYDPEQTLNYTPVLRRISFGAKLIF